MQVSADSFAVSVGVRVGSLERWKDGLAEGSPCLRDCASQAEGLCLQTYFSCRLSVLRAARLAPRWVAKNIWSTSYQSAKLHARSIYI